MHRPPLPVLVAYRLFGWRLGPAYREWVLDDVVRRGWLLRQGLPAVAALLAVGGGVFALYDADGERLFSLVVVLAGAGAFLRGQLKARALDQQGLDASGTPLARATWYDDDRARVRRNALSVVASAALVVGGLAILASRSPG